MHVLINGRFLSRSPTGVDRTAQELVRALGKLEVRGMTIHCAVPADAPADAEIRARLCLTAESVILRSRLRGYLFEQLALPQMMPEAILLSLCNIGPVVRRRQIVMLHDAQAFDAPQSYGAAFRMTYRLLQPVLARRCGMVLTVSNYSRERLRQTNITGKRQAEVVPNGADHFERVVADHSVLTRTGLPAGGYALAFANPAMHKNIAIVLAAYATHDKDLPPLVLAGSPPTGFALDDGRIRVLGRVTDGELKALYQNAKMFLFPSLTEGFGFPALEAMTCGCPVIAADAGAIPEVVGDAARLIDPRDWREWARVIARLHIEDDERGRMIDAGRLRARRFTWHVAATRLAGLIESYAVNN
ncbi:glycosyltransferase family 4 protein [Novosphingobium aquiterrae]|uniref:Glycosyltransferase family 4 protein n=1 Tax=Novosphingobium aquiterrae TaxID=624388 RepID=A0ABV6PF81_9SPHN